MRAANFDPEDLVKNLQGSCGDSISSCFGEEGILNEDFTPKYPNMTEDDMIDSDYSYIDNFIFLCANCGWWCDTSEENDGYMGQTCDDCYDEEINEE